ncbi:MAG TPA: MazG-like family protein [Candidatus Saccharimonadales bacterium]|jgi:NTP pyrophosphatase (non-canonical NTP hydrolase)|nr:MazG-like family protein [Candidatus Saccharimonadales bacterium]
MTPQPQSDITFEDISQLIWKHLEERDWLDNPSRGLAISIALEANELLEHYQWQDKPVGDKHALGEELADILIYAFQFAQKEGIDMPAAIKAKLAKAAKKYPAATFKGKNNTERREAWIDAKLHHKKEGL